MNAALFTADTCARAIIAAAEYYKIDPVVAVNTPQGHRQRSAVVAAASAINTVLDVPMPTVVRVFDIGPNAIYAARARTRARCAMDAAIAVVRALVDAATQPTPEPPASPPAPRPADPPRLAPVLPVYRPGPPAEPKAPIQHRPAPGAITAQFAPTLGLPSSLPRAERPLADLILEVLQDGSASAMGLASLLGAKETLVTQSLSGLKHNGLVEAGDVPPEGIRHQRWSLVQRAAA